MTDDEKEFYLMLCGWESEIAIKNASKKYYITGVRYWTINNMCPWLSIEKAFRYQKELDCGNNKR
jgi:hypothetical protein